MRRKLPDLCRRWGPVAGIILCSVAMQIVFLFRVLDDPNTLSWPDPRHYHLIAENLYQGGAYSVPRSEYNIYRSPGFPLLLSWIMHLVGPGILHLRLFLVFLTVPFLLILYKLAGLVGNRRTGLLAVALGAVYPLYIYTPLTLYPESILVFMFAAIALILFYARNNRRPALLALLSLVVTLAVLVRPTSVVWIPVAFFYLFWGQRPNPGRFLGAAAALILVPAVCIAFWTYRNYRVHGCAVFTTAGSVNLLMCYNDDATGRKLDTALEPELQPGFTQASTTAQREKMRMEKAKSFIFNHPGKALKIAATQCLDLWNPIPPTTTQGGMAQPRYKLINAATYVPVLVLAIGGLFLRRKSLLVQSFLLLVVLNTLANGIVSVSVRYRLVTDFVLIVLAACFLTVLFTVAYALFGRVAADRHQDLRHRLAHAWQWQKAASRKEAKL
jgi:4-amino-4-deoxy-L-arabinose transferase-like glycosyltransferase